MKRLLTVAVCAILACAGMATPTLAGSFGLFYGGRHGYDGAVSIRPYNAFSPVLYGDVPGYNQDGGAGQGAYGPIAYRHGCANGNCGQGGCGQGGCGQGGYGCGQGGCGQGGYGYGQGGYGYGWGNQGYDYRLGMVNLRGPNDTNNVGSLGYAPPDGYGNGAFGNYGLGRLSVFGSPVDGGCLSCPKNYWTLNTQQAPMTCGPQGCAPSYGLPETYPAQSMTPIGSYPSQLGAPITTPPMLLPTPAIPGEVKPPLLPVPNKPKTSGTTMQGSPMPGGVQAQPVSYAPGYTVPAQQMMPYGYTQPTWGYYGYPMNYPAWGYQGW